MIDHKALPLEHTPLQLALLPLHPGSHNPPQSCEAGFVEGRQGQISRKLKISCLPLPRIDPRLGIVVNIYYSGIQAFLLIERSTGFFLTTGKEGFIGSWNFEDGLAEPSLIVSSLIEVA